MTNKTLLIIVIIALFTFNLWAILHYFYIPRDESYVFVNEIYVKCHIVDNGTECILPDGKTLQIIKVYNSTIK